MISSMNDFSHVDKSNLTSSNSIKAQELANLGWAVFPLIERDKKPATTHGFHDASSERDLVASLFFANPNYNIGIATGEVSGGIVVIDADMKLDKNIDGTTVIQSWQTEHGAWPETVEALSGGGGRHWYFCVPYAVKNSVNAEVGVDVRGEGGYIVAPPSVHPNGSNYAWVEGHSPFDLPVAAANESVLAFLREIGAKNQLDQEKWQKKEVVPEGTRDNELFRACCSWRARGYDYEEILKRARAYNTECFIPPLPDEDIVAKVKHVIEAYESERRDTLRNKLKSTLDKEHLDVASINDKQLSRLFARLYGSELRYCAEERSFYCYNGIYWEVDTESLTATCLIKEFTDFLDHYAIEQSTLSDTKLFEATKKYQSKSARKSLLEDAKSELKIERERFDSDLGLFNVANATIDLTMGEVREHVSENLITQCAPVNYDPEARCELWKKVLQDAFAGDMETIEYLQRLLGMSLLGDTSRALFHIAGFMTRSGKSVVFNTVANLLGTGQRGYACILPGDTFARSSIIKPDAPRNDLAMLQGSRFALISELDPTAPFNSELIKTLTGQDTLATRSNYQGYRYFRPYCNVVILGNTMPAIADKVLFSSGRLRLLPFERRVPEKKIDPTLLQKLGEPESLSGILNWLLEGVCKYKEQGIEPSQLVKDKTAKLAAKYDFATKFISECLIENEGARISLADVHTLYEQWCKNNYAHTYTKEELRQELEARNIFVGKRKKDMRDPIDGWAIRGTSCISEPIR